MHTHPRTPTHAHLLVLRLHLWKALQRHGHIKRLAPAQQAEQQLMQQMQKT